MARVRRRSWASGRQPRKDGLRLSTMVVLLAIVLVLMFAASRPGIWTQLVPGLDSQAPATKTNVEIAPTKAEPAPPQTDPTRLRLIGLIILAVMYFGWRFARMGRALKQHRPPKRLGPGMSSPTPSPPHEG
jgi:hypothetical protein